MQVRRLLVLLKAMQLDRRVGALHDALQAGKQRGAAPHSASRAPLAYGWVPATGLFSGSTQQIVMLRAYTRLLLFPNCKWRQQPQPEGAPTAAAARPPAAGPTSGACPATRPRRLCCTACRRGATWWSSWRGRRTAPRCSCWRSWATLSSCPSASPAWQYWRASRQAARAAAAAAAASECCYFGMGPAASTC